MVQDIYLLVSQRTLSTAVDDPVGIAFLAFAELLLVIVFVQKLDLLDYVPGYIAHQVKIVVRSEVFIDDERDIAGNRRIFADFDELLTHMELLFNPLVVGPEEPDIRKSHADDSQPLQAKAESPAVIAFYAEFLHNALLGHAAA